MKKLLCLLPLLLLVSCLDAIYVTQTFEFEGNRWPTTDAKTFKVTLEKDMEHATIKLVFSHVFEPQYASVPLSGTLTLPSGKTEPINLTLQLKDPQGAALSDCAGDVCDLTAVIKEGVNLEKGVYEFTVHNDFNGPYLPNVLALSFTIDSSNHP